MSDRYRFVAELWRWAAQDGWYFVSVPKDDSAEIEERPREPRGFGSIRVEATIGGSTWRTSIFPDSKLGCYVLPVKKAVRAAERIDAPDEIEVAISLLE